MHCSRLGTHGTNMRCAGTGRRYAEHDAVVFHDTCFIEVGLVVFAARHINEDWGYRWLYRHYVHLSL